MNRQKELAKNTLILTIGKICTQFVSFLLLPLYTALLVPEEYGIFDLFNTYITLLTPIFNWQFENGLFRFMIDERNDFDRQKKLFSTVLLTNVVQTGLYLLLFATFQGLIHSKYKVFLALDVTLNILLNTLLQFPRGLGKNVIYSVGSFISASATVVLNIVFIVLLHWRAYGLFIATLLGKIITIVYLFYSMKAWKYISFRNADREIFKNVAMYSLPLVPNQLSWWVVGASDRSVISHFIDVAANGIYSVANKFSTVYVTFYNIFNLSWTESVSIHMHDEDCDGFLTDVINTIFNLFSAADLGIIACVPFLFKYGFINAQYGEAYFQVPILMIAVLFQVVVGLYSVVYVALKKTKEIAKTSLLAAVINLAVDLILIKRLGLYAASVSTLAAYASMAIYRYFDVKKYVNVCFRSRNIVITTIVASLTIILYYTENSYGYVVCLIIVGIYAILMNRSFLLSLLTEVKERIKKSRRVL